MLRFGCNFPIALLEMEAGVPRDDVREVSSYVAVLDYGPATG